jgi:hypothetical protein
MHTLKVATVVLLAASSLHGKPLFGLDFHFWGKKAAVEATPAGAKWAAAKVFEPKTPVPAAADLLACVNTVATKLGVDALKQTEPALLKDILTNDMHLIEHPKVAEIFKDALANPKPLGKMIEDVKKGATDPKHNPAIGVAMCSALEDPKAKVVFENVNKDVIKRTVHHMFLLDRLVEELGNNVDFMEDMQKYLRTITDKMSGSTSAISRGWAMFRAAGWFGLSKDVTLTFGINGFIKARKAGSLTESEQKTRSRNLAVNILEATMTDFVHGYFANARVGKDLTFQLAQGVKVEGPNKVMRYGLSDNWARHYQTWNLAFITGNLDYLNLLYPKLLIPRVMLADGPAYIYERVIALWLSLNFYLMADLSKKEHVKFAGKEDLAKLWGDINERYIAYIHAEDGDKKK